MRQGIVYTTPRPSWDVEERIQRSHGRGGFKRNAKDFYEGKPTIPRHLKKRPFDRNATKRNARRDINEELDGF